MCWIYNNHQCNLLCFSKTREMQNYMWKQILIKAWKCPTICHFLHRSDALPLQTSWLFQQVMLFFIGFVDKSCSDGLISFQYFDSAERVYSCTLPLEKRKNPPPLKKTSATRKFRRKHINRKEKYIESFWLNSLKLKIRIFSQIIITWLLLNNLKYI